MTRPFAPIGERVERRHRAPERHPRFSRRRPADDRSTRRAGRVARSSACANATARSGCSATASPAGWRSKRIDDVACGTIDSRRGAGRRGVRGSSSLARARRAADAPAIDTRAEPNCSTCCSTAATGADRLARCWRPMRGRRLNDALEQLRRARSAIAPGGWPEVQQRLADDAPGCSTTTCRPISAIWDACRERARSVRPGDLAGLSDPLRADSDADARCRAVPLLPVLSIACAVRSPAGPRLRGHADRRFDCRGRTAPAAARHQHERDQAEPRRPSRRHRSPRAELLCLRRRVGDRPRRRGRLREPDRDVPRRHDGGRVGLLRDRPDGRSRVLHARRIGRPAAHARTPARPRGRGHRAARALAHLR